MLHTRHTRCLVLLHTFAHILQGAGLLEDLLAFAASSTVLLTTRGCMAMSHHHGGKVDKRWCHMLTAKLLVAPCCGCQSTLPLPLPADFA
jgi:hypothetical protein